VAAPWKLPRYFFSLERLAGSLSFAERLQRKRLGEKEERRK
jgi:hypothetical protein